MKTKTLQNAKNYSNDSSHIIFSDSSDYKDIVLGATPFGERDIDDIYTDYENNVENALQDLASISMGQIGDIVIKDSNTSPSGFSQVDNWSFSSPSNIVYEEDETINILGKKVEMLKGSTIENVVISTQKVIQDYIDEGLYFSKVSSKNFTCGSHSVPSALPPHSPTITGISRRSCVFLCSAKRH